MVSVPIEDSDHDSDHAACAMLSENLLLSFHDFKQQSAVTD